MAGSMLQQQQKHIHVEKFTVQIRLDKRQREILAQWIKDYHHIAGVVARSENPKKAHTSECARLWRESRKEKSRVPPSYDVLSSAYGHVMDGTYVRESREVSVGARVKAGRIWERHLGFILAASTAPPDPLRSQYDVFNLSEMVVTMNRYDYAKPI